MELNEEDTLLVEGLVSAAAVANPGNQEIPEPQAEQETLLATLRNISFIFIISM